MIDQQRIDDHLYHNSNLLDILEIIKNNNVETGRVYSELPTLNDVFLTITGKELRDKD